MMNISDVAIFFKNSKKILAAHWKLEKNLGPQEKPGNIFFSKNLYNHSLANQNYSHNLKTLQTCIKPPILRRERNSGQPRAFTGRFCQKTPRNMC